MLSSPISSLLFFSSSLPLSHLSFCHSIIGVLEAGSIVFAFGDISAAMIYEGSDDGDWKLSHRAERHETGFQECMQWGMAIGVCLRMDAFNVLCYWLPASPVMLSGGLTERQHIALSNGHPFHLGCHVCKSPVFCTIINLAKWLKSFPFSWSC